MNDKERFSRLMKGEVVDRPPLLDEGVREEVLETWRLQGMPAERTHLEIFDLTVHERVGPDLRFRAEYFGKVLELYEDEYRRAFDVSMDRYPEDWHKTVQRLKHRDFMAGIWATRGLFQALGVGDWATLEAVLYAFVEEPARLRDRMEIYGDFCARMLELTLREVEPDFIYVSEPISDNRGPLISPAMFEALMVPVYDKVTAVARSHGVMWMLLSTYGNSAALLPTMIDAGMNLLWISEASESPDMDYLRIRRRFGTDLGLIGGIPLSIIRRGCESEIDKRLHEIVVPLLQSGRYIPLAGGRVREGISWQAYRYYREVLASIVNP